jgi:hypothetical protein
MFVLLLMKRIVMCWPRPEGLDQQQRRDLVFNVTVAGTNRATDQHLQYQRLTAMTNYGDSAASGAGILLAELIFDQPGFVKGYSELVIEVNMYGPSAAASAAATNFRITYESHFYLWSLALERILFAVGTMLLFAWWATRLSKLPNASYYAGTAQHDVERDYV